MNGGQNLGGAQYTVTANTQQFVHGLKEAEEHAHRLASSVQQSGRGAAMGLLQLGYAIDDIQYGFSAIVNNIPQIVMGFGGGAGIAGAAGIAVVAISQLSKHYGDFNDQLQAQWIAKSTEELKGLSEQMAKVRAETEGAAKAYEKLAEAHSKMQAKAAEVNKEAIAEGGVDRVATAIAATLQMNQGLLSAKQQKFIEQHAWYGLTKQKATDQMTKEEAQRLLGAANNPQATEEARQNARTRINELVKTNPGAFPPGFQMRSPEDEKRQAQFEKEADARKEVQHKIEQANKEHLAKMIQDAEGRKHADHAFEQGRKEFNKKSDELNEAGEENERRMRMNQLRNRQDELEEQSKIEKLKLTPKQREIAEKRALGIEANEPSQVMSMKAIADKMLTQGASQVPEKQLNKLVEMLKELRDLNKEMKKVGRLE